MGRIGAFLPVMPGAAPVDDQRVAVRRLEAAGYGCAWSNEIVGKDVFVQLGILLAATEKMIFGTCIANMWARPPQTAAAASAQLADAYPGRFVLGLGVGFPQQAESVGRDFGQPLATARSYLEAVGHDPAYPRLLGAMGPKMVGLAGEAADGALPAGVDPASTAATRRALGPDRLLVTYLDASGDPSEVLDVTKAHLQAGADHVIMGSVLGADFAAHIEVLVGLSPVLADLAA
jgi:probable F420-dependent oxidoreductase